MHMRYEGYNGQIVADMEASTLTITREGVVAKVNFGKGAPRIIPLAAISAVRLVPATRVRNGHLTLGLNGSDAPELGLALAASNMDTVLFTSKKSEIFQQLHEWLLAVIQHHAELGVDSTAHEASGGRPARSQELSEMVAEQKEKSAERGARAQVASARNFGNSSSVSGPLFVGQSHESGRNATVTLWPDRIERVKHSSMASWSNVKQDSEVTPIRAVSSVGAKKDGIINTKVTVYATGNNIEFRFAHAQAMQFKNAIQALILAPPAAPVVQVLAPQNVPDLADQLIRLAGLRDKGILTEEEFAGHKAKLLDQ